MPIPHLPPAVDLSDVPFQGIVEQSLAGIYVVLDERFMYANDRFAEMFGYGREEFIGRRMADCVTPDSVPEVMENYRRRISGEVDTIHYYTRGVRKDGRIVNLELHASRVTCQGRPALAGVALDITERVQAQEELAQSRERLRELAQHINRMREIERARLAREVHDVLGGMLTSAKFEVARILRRTASDGRQDLHDIASELLVLLQETIVTARTVSDDLRPGSLDVLGLGPALAITLERFGARHGVAATLAGAEAWPDLPPAAGVQVFRIVQEALTNVARHARARAVGVELARGEGLLRLAVRDDGIGIGATVARPGAIGLFSMAERAREIGATLAVQPRAGGGTEVLLELPWSAAA
jgi:PAS domain S-box-containing protein